MRRVELIEYGEAEECPGLSEAQWATLRDCRLVKVEQKGKALRRVKASTSRIGATVVGSGAGAVELRIRPKLPIKRILFMAGYAYSRLRWQDHELHVEEHEELLPALADVFARMAERTLARNVLMGYRTVEQALPVVRGQIRTSDQVNRHFGMALPVEVSYSDPTIDTPENRILLTAAERLLALPDVDTTTRRLLHRVVGRLPGVARLHPGAAAPRWIATRLNAGYWSVLGLAEVVLRGNSFETADGQIHSVDGLLMIMHDVFEDFVTKALADALRPYGGSCHPQDTRTYLDHARTVQLIPDLVYDAPGPNGTEYPRAVVDAKYKVGRDSGGNPTDLYQALAYCTALDLRSGHLVYASGAGVRAKEHRFNGKEGVVIHQHELELDRPPAAVLAQIDVIAKMIVAQPHSQMS
ncbi:McrC family protein [Nocardiopsis mangrovi]|uniref:McrC family protein n=1 Tax=Nocardiopsis mangrovi TaxID=1179818 RepID=A0ABV9DX03_9ACTN